MKKLALRLTAMALLAMALFIVAVVFYMHTLIKQGVETMGPKIAGVEMKLEMVNLSLFSGRGEIKGLLVGNPKGYRSGYAIKISRADVSLQPSSLFSQKIIVHSVTLQAPAINFEGAWSSNNLGQILRSFEQFTASQAVAPPSGARKPAKKLQVDDFLIRDAHVTVNLTTLSGERAFILPLMEIRLQNLGRDSDGINAIELARQVLKAILEHSTAAVEKTLDHASQRGAGQPGPSAAGVLEPGRKQ